MSTNPESSVIDQIDALIDEQMAGGEYAAIERTEAAVGALDRCALCGGAWHGSPWTGVDYEHLGEYDLHHHGRSLRCPGAFATGPQRIRYRWHDRYRSPMRYPMGRSWAAAAPQSPIQRYRQHLQAINEFIEALTEGDPALQQWQREQRARWLNDTAPNLPPELQFPRPRFAYVGESRGPSIEYAEIDEPYTIDTPQPRRGVPWLQQQHRDPWRITIGETGATYPGPTATPLAPITLPKLYMAPARGGQQSVTRYSRRGPVLMRYWGSPQAAGTWWELDPGEGPWTDVEVTTTQDEPPRRRRDRSLPPLQRVFIELTAASGLRANPVGLIAVGANHRDGPHRVHRAYLKSMTDRPPLLYDDDRRASSWQPTSWAQRGAADVHPERLVDAIRGVEGL